MEPPVCYWLTGKIFSNFSCHIVCGCHIYLKLLQYKRKACNFELKDSLILIFITFTNPQSYTDEKIADIYPAYP